MGGRGETVVQLELVPRRGARAVRAAVGRNFGEPGVKRVWGQPLGRISAAGGAMGARARAKMLVRRCLARCAFGRVAHFRELRTSSLLAVAVPR